MHRQIVEACWQLIRRYVANAPQCRGDVDRTAMRAEPTHPPECWAQVGRGSSNTLARIGSMDGAGPLRRRRSGKGRAVPALSVDSRFAALNPFYGDRSRMRWGGDWR